VQLQALAEEDQRLNDELPGEISVFRHVSMECLGPFQWSLLKETKVCQSQSTIEARKGLQPSAKPVASTAGPLAECRLFFGATGN